MFLLLFALTRADELPLPCDGKAAGDAGSQDNGDPGTCQSCGQNCVECTASSDSPADSSGKGDGCGCHSVGLAPLGLLMGAAGLFALRRR